jgi:soluble lytic murein transglycosylase-like protein
MIISLVAAILMYAVCFHTQQELDGLFGIQGVRFSDEIAQAADEYGVHPALIMAIIQVESNFNPQAMSFKGAKGLMQITSPTQHYLRAGDLYDPFQNIRAGTKYIKELIELFDGDVALALAAYNAGPGAVLKYNGIPPYSETKKYVKKVMAYFDQFRQSLSSSSLAS